MNIRNDRSAVPNDKMSLCIPCYGQGNEKFIWNINEELFARNCFLGGKDAPCNKWFLWEN